ncbi:2814_t:CDS:1, partial [Cetraspora pellucida]
KKQITTKQRELTLKETNNTTYKDQSNEISQKNPQQQITTLSEYTTYNTIQHHGQKNNISKNMFWWDTRYTLNKNALMPLTFSWDQICLYCSTVLFTSELAEFCCNQGKHLILLLPHYSMNMNIILSDPKISSFLQKLNALFSFTAIEIQV